MVEGFDIEVLPQPYHMQAIPVPRRGPNGWTEEEADALHATYVKALQALYASHVDKYGGPMAPKEIQLVD